MTIGSEIHFCPRCGEPISRQIKFGKERPVCKSCGWVYVQDPKVAVTALIRQEGRPSNNAQYTSAGEGSVLLTRRINEPFKGKWTLPGGFVDAFEDPSEAIRRECLEETGLTIAVNRLRELLSGREHANGSDILIVYDARIIGGELKPGDDADRAEFFPLHSLPELAFQSTAKILHEIS